MNNNTSTNTCNSNDFEEQKKPDCTLPLVSIIIPVKNCEKFLDECFGGILKQTFVGPLEVSIFDDHSSDNSPEIITSWIKIFNQHGIKTQFRRNDQDASDPLKTGCGYSKNRAVEQSTGEYLCFQDADDIMLPQRIELQLEAAKARPNCIVGSNFVREPADATPRYKEWCNRLTEEQLITQQFRECTIVQPTWFYTRKIYDLVGGYAEHGPRTPEDLIFFHKHLDLGGKLFKVDIPLVVYRYHQNATSHKIHRLKLMDVRVEALENRVLKNWETFSIWGAGRDGRKLFGALSLENKKKLVAFCDVDVKKIGKDYHQAYTNLKVPVVHFSQVKPPLIICVSLDRTDGQFEANLASLNLVEGVDYFHFN